jgi:hypothetical protein
MKYFLLLIFALTAAAQPINYQGKLTDKSGNPISGDKEVSLKVYDAKTDGKLTYEEAIGPVTLTKGIYSFNFGEDGKSVATATETVGSTDGEKQIFNHTAANIPIVGDVKITAGDYSWSDTGGASSSSQFTATANKESGQVSAIFISGAPAAGTEITVTYDYHSTGIMGALSASSHSWLEVTIGGETLSPRERLVAVPFALYADKAKSLDSASLPETQILNRGSIWSDGWGGNIVGNAGEEQPTVQSPSDEVQNFTLFKSKINIPSKATYLKVSFAHIVAANNYGGSSERRNVNAKFNLVINDQIAAKKVLKTEWSQPAGKNKFKVYADYSNLVVPINNISGLQSFKIDYEYIDGGQVVATSNNVKHSVISVGSIMYLIIIAGFN